MAAVDYCGIRAAIEKIMETAIEPEGVLEGARLFIEEEPQFGLADYDATISVFLERRGPSSDQNAAAGRRTRFDMQISFWVCAFDMSSYREACDKRDRIVGQLELLLMANRILKRPNGSDLNDTFQMEGGEIYAAKNATNNAFTAVAETKILIQVAAIID